MYCIKKCLASKALFASDDVAYCRTLAVCLSSYIVRRVEICKLSTLAIYVCSIGADTSESSKEIFGFEVLPKIWKIWYIQENYSLRFSVALTALSTTFAAEICENSRTSLWIRSSARTKRVILHRFSPSAVYACIHSLFSSEYKWMLESDILLFFRNLRFWAGVSALIKTILLKMSFGNSDDKLLTVLRNSGDFTRGSLITTI